jgi:CRISPR-associated endonuclease Csn1
MSREAKFDYRGKMRLENFPAPMERFYHLAEESIASILVSYRNNKRLLSLSINKTKKKNKNNVQRNLAVRGPLHEATLYGQISHPSNGNPVYVVRKLLAELKVKQLDGIIDEAIKKHLKELTINSNPEDKISKLFPEGVFMKSKNPELKVPIYKVRVQAKSASMIAIRTKENSRLFVEPGSNYCSAFYENADGKIEENVITFFDGINRKKLGIPAVPPSKENKKLLFTLQINDLVLIDADPAEIENSSPKDISKKLYRVQNLSKGDYSFRHHLAAKIDSKESMIRIRSMKDMMRVFPIIVSSTGKFKFHHLD